MHGYVQTRRCMHVACVVCTFDTLPVICMYTDAVDFGCMASSRACARSCSFPAGRRWRARRCQNGKWPSHHPLTRCCPTDRSSLLPLLVSFFSLFSLIAFILFQFSRILLCFILLGGWVFFGGSVCVGRG